ncbi:MAG: hypothetical protein ABIH84_00055 [bacterium]
MTCKSIRSKGIALPLVLIIVALVIGSGITGAFLATRNSSDQNASALNSLERRLNQLTNKQTNDSGTDENVDDSASLNSTDLKDWERLGVDSTWDMYKMNYLGFSVRVPRQMYIPNAGCSYEESNGKHSYRPKGGYAEVRLFNTKDTALFVNNDFSQLGDETEDSEGYHYYGKCTKLVVGLDNIHLSGTHYWEFVTSEIGSDKELTQFVRDYYGPGCDVTKKASAVQPGTYDVWIESGGMEDSSCPINFMYTIKYSPTKKLAVIWNRGQSCTFVANADWLCNDDEVNSSFRFLE